MSWVMKVTVYHQDISNLLYAVSYERSVQKFENQHKFEHMMFNQDMLGNH